MAQQTGHTKPTPSGRSFSAREADDGFLDVNVKGDSDEDTALGQAIKECDALRMKQTSNLRKIAELERRLKNKDTELQALKQSQGSSKPMSSGHLLRASSVDSATLKEKDAKIRFLEREMERAKAYEKQVTELTIQMTLKDKEISQLKKASGKGASGSGKSQVQEPQSVQELTAELEKWRGHSKAQSRQVLVLRQELEGVKLEVEERLSLLVEAEREKSSLFQQLKTVRAERDEFVMRQHQLEKEVQVLKQQELETTLTSQLIEVQMGGSTCVKRECESLRKNYTSLAAENTTLKANLAKISKQLSASEIKLAEKHKIITELIDKVEITQSQAASNKADFEEERKDRMKAHSKFAELETELVDMEERSKRQGKHVQELAVQKHKLEKELAKRLKVGNTVEATYKQLKIENDRLTIQLAEAKKSVMVMAEEMKKTKSKKKQMSEEHLKRFKRLVSKSGEESMECKLTEARNLIEMMCATNEDLEAKVIALTVANNELTKMESAWAKIPKQSSLHVPHESSEPNSIGDEKYFFFTDVNTAGLPYIEEHAVAGAGQMATDPKQTGYRSTPTEGDQLSLLPHHFSATGGHAYKEDIRRSSDPELRPLTKPTSKTLSSAKDELLPPIAGEMQQHHFNPSSSNPEPQRANVPLSFAANLLQEPSLTAGGVPQTAADSKQTFMMTPTLAEGDQLSPLSPLSDLSTTEGNTNKGDISEEEKAYKIHVHITKLQTDLSTVKKELKSHQAQSAVKDLEHQKENERFKTLLTETSETLKTLRQEHAELCASKQQVEDRVQTLQTERYNATRQLQELQATIGDELAPYSVVLKEPELVDKKVGSGCYGTVYAVEIDGIQCIAKRVQDILIPAQHYDVQGLQRRGIEEKFRRECILMSKIRHPNIVQFMGVRYGRDKYDLTLVMERLPMDLQKCLERCEGCKYFIPLSIRFSILVDVTYGLLHLHNRSILHRDLTAGNILLTSNLRAKIADLGVSRIFEGSHTHLQNLSKNPGTVAYMPPEALKEKPVYDLTLDIFSFGVLALFVTLQTFPAFSWDHIPDSIAAKGERELFKRKQWMDKIGSQHFLYPLIHQCLQDDSKARPSTMELNTMMKELSARFPRKLQHLNKMIEQLCKLGMSSILLC